jgi:hypothetical protein
VQAVHTTSAVEVQADDTYLPAAQKLHGVVELAVQKKFTGQATGAASPPAQTKFAGQATKASSVGL